MDAPQETTGQPVPPAGGWSDRPVPPPPWWRRRGPRLAMAAGAVVVLVLAGAGVWLAAHPPQNNAERLRGMLVVPPAGSRPRQLHGTSGEAVDVEDFARIMKTSPVTLRQVGFRGIAARGWYTGRDANAYDTVMLVDFDSAADAGEVEQAAFGGAFGGAVGGSAAAGSDVPDVPGAKSFWDTAADGEQLFHTRAVARRDTVVVLIDQTRPSQPDPAGINELTRRQYERL